MSDKEKIEKYYHDMIGWTFWRNRLPRLLEDMEVYHKTVNEAVDFILNSKENNINNKITVRYVQRIEKMQAEMRSDLQKLIDGLPNQINGYEEMHERSESPLR